MRRVARQRRQKVGIKRGLSRELPVLSIVDGGVLRTGGGEGNTR